VSDFHLDKYEVTVGRFRQFVDAGMGTQTTPPKAGAGAHPLIPGSGWSSAWNTSLSPDTAALKAAMLCNYPTWTDTPGNNERLPINCLDWFTASAFCAWDGGRLATEAEWNYAAAGGSEQRVYPWSNPPTSTTIDDSYAAYCGGSCGRPQNVGSKSPKGDGKWGQSDLAGNVWEWTMDWYASPYPMPCTDCSALAVGSKRVVRGGEFNNVESSILSAYRIGSPPESHFFDTGVRCAGYGDTSGAGGSSGAGGTGGAGGAGGSGGTATTARPCDIYAAEGGPCVAAHSTVRALLGTYVGPLYQVRRADGTTKDIPVAPGGFADHAVQDAFCGSTACTISIIYDQSGRGNHLTKAPPGGAKATADNEADAKVLPIMVGGYNVYGEHNPPGVGYRNDTAVGTATGDDPETIYMVTSGDHYNSGCCFDYGNAETNNHDNGEGTMEAVNFGNCILWNKGSGAGPWVMGDLENGLWAGNTSPAETNTSVSYKYVTALVKGDKAATNHWAIKAGNAQSGGLTTMFDGIRPSARYIPMKKEGAIVLGISGDNSNSAQGNFFEGLMTAHYSSNAADDAVQANIVAARYGQ
jgi:formylglycine-generating enzyme required for sulfatase activity